MPSIKPKNVSAALVKAARDGQITEKEADGLGRAVVRDLVKNAANPEETLKAIAGKLDEFLAPYAARDSQEENGVFLGRSERYGMTDLQNGLEQAADKLDTIQAGLFSLVMSLSFQDGKLDKNETNQLEKLAEKVVAESANPDETAAAMRNVIIEFESVIAQNAAMGMGYDRDEMITKGASQGLKQLNAFLGSAIASGIERPGQGQTIDASSDLGQMLSEIAESDGMERGMAMEMLPRLVDKELAKFDSEGLTGQAKFKMDQQLEARAGAIVAFVEGLNAGGDQDDLMQNVYRIATGKFLPPSQMDEFKGQLATLDGDEIRAGVRQFEERIEDLSGGESFSIKNERAGLMDGLEMLKAELASRAQASGLSGLGSAESKQAALDFIKADPNMQALLSDGASLREDTTTFFDWQAAKTELEGEFGSGTNLDTVLQNLVQDFSMSSRDVPDHYAFARVAMDIPNEVEPWPLTVIFKRDGNEWNPSAVSGTGLPL
jgi:hypothetical protein